MFRRKHSQNHQENGLAEQEAKVVSKFGRHLSRKLLFFVSPYKCHHIKKGIYDFTIIPKQGLWTKWETSFKLLFYLNKIRFPSDWKTDVEYFFCKQVSELRAALGPLSDRSVKYCTDACLRRYLIARNWNVDKAKKMLEETLKWRATYKPEEIRWVCIVAYLF
jgi:hypothetical protein